MTTSWKEHTHNRTTSLYLPKKILLTQYKQLVGIKRWDNAQEQLKVGNPRKQSNLMGETQHPPIQSRRRRVK